MVYAVPREEGAHIQILTAFLADGGLISGLDYGITKGAWLELRLVVLGTRRGGGLVCWMGYGPAKYVQYSTARGSYRRRS